MVSWDSSVTIATGYGLDDRGEGVRVPVGSRAFSSPRRPDRLWSPPNLLSNGHRGFFLLGVKRPGHEADHSPPASAEVKKKPSWRSAWLVKHRDNFTFLLLHGELCREGHWGLHIGPCKRIKVASGHVNNFFICIFWTKLDSSLHSTRYIARNAV
jgi:hypothetical protein